jgi:hypothetical protein
MLVGTAAVMMLMTGLAPAAFADDDGPVAKGGDGGDGGIGIGIGACIIASCDDVGSGNGSGGDGGDAKVKD